MKNKFGLVMIGLMLTTSLAIADEGMWQPHQLPLIKQQLLDRGLNINPETLSTLTEFPMNAVISLGGCTASFVSSQGLAVTNHHCAYGSIQYNSTKDNNLINKGFISESFEGELPAAPGSRIYVTEELTDVTALIMANLNDNLSGEARYKMIEQRQKSLVAACEKSPGYRCSTYSYHGGLSYYLIKQLEIRDVRLVYAPPSNIGKFGGDTDNWMWPRHTGDWSFYRAYVNPKGQPADFSKKNVPYQPKSHLQVSAKGLNDGDFVMVAGYPGRTNRYRIADEVSNQFEWVYPTAKRYREESMEIIKRVAPKGSAANVKYLSTLAGLANYAKNYGSMIASYQKGDMLTRKLTLEAQLKRWINSDSTRQKQYSQSIEQLADLVKDDRQHQIRELIFGYMNRSAMMSVAQKLYRLAQEKTKPDAERELGYQVRDMTRFAQGIKRISKRYDAQVDREIVTHFMKYYLAMAKTERVSAFDRFYHIKANTEMPALTGRLKAMYQQTRLGDESKRMAWLTASVEQFQSSDDPFIKYAVAMYDTQMAQEKEDKERAGLFQKVRPNYMAALIAYKKSLGQAVYADANSSLRVTYGNVKGYSPKDGLYATPFTTLEGKLDKYIAGDEEFDITVAERQAIVDKTYGRYYNKGIGSVPLNFLSTVDTTGGNSGSPTLNAKAQLVGLLFDGVYESIISDWDFDPKISRSIHLDSRYMLWIMEHVSGADNLLQEMDIVDE